MIEHALIHIGYHKTGTTWFQKHLFVKGNEFFFPISVNESGPSSFADYFISDEKNYLLSPYELNTDEIYHRISQFISKEPGIHSKTLVLSHERLSGNPHSGGFDGQILSERIKAVFPKGKILIVIREQRSFILSNYFQYVKIGGRHDLKHYLQTTYDRKIPGFSPNHINYLPAVKQYHRLFGKENVLVVPFELFTSDPAEFIRRLGILVGKEIVIDQARYDKVVNKSEKYVSAYYLRKISARLQASSINNYRTSNKILIPLYKIFDKLISMLTSQKKEERLLASMKREIDAFCGDRYSKANSELGTVLNEDLSVYGYQ